VNRTLCLGLLGFSGNYGEQDYKKLVDALSFGLDNYSLIDLSTDYGIDYNLVNVLKTMDLKNTSARFIYKVGCNYSEAYDVNELVCQTLQDFDVFGIDRINSLLFHRPSVAKISSDTEFFSCIRASLPNIPFGICTNSKSIYDLYKKQMDIQIVQLALNPFDYAENIPFLNILNQDKVTVQARSILSSGLLSGKYDRKSVFSDNLRSRYHHLDFSSKYLKRISTASKIIQYVEEKYKLSKGEIPVFLYSAFEKIPTVDIVIRGGSSLQQISSNLSRIPIDEIAIKDFLSKMIIDWKCEYV
tara:strand:- start:2628 stop:3527 length:900 start_codon:yes stop_codon:yes gene_type:complete